MQFQFKRLGLEEIVTILTFDQCQGQEADVVILSLVRKPTRFLDKNRMNVALSRVRKKLYFVADKDKFREKSSEASWECSQLAQDLLEISGEDIRGKSCHDYLDGAW